jgi:two-component system, sensor histidine kinase
MDNRSTLLRELVHELRDALSPIRSAIDVVRLRRLEGELGGPLVERIERSLDRALTLLDAFALAEQCEDGTLTMRPSRTSLGQLLAQSRALLPRTLQPRCVLKPSELDLGVTADVERSVLVLTAMLEQALAAAPEGAPIEVESGADAGGHGYIRVGLAAGAPAAAGGFEGYRAPGGVRLALRIARCLMRRQGGELALVREGSDGGSLLASFGGEATARADTPPAAVTAIRAEPERPPSTPPQAQRSAQLRGTRILIVEDSVEVRRAYREALTELGYSVTEARNAEEALARAADVTPAVALIDIHLPGMNGYRLAQALKARIRSGLHLVMLSGVTLDETTQQLSKNAGFDECFDKARGPKALNELLLRLL